MCVCLSLSLTASDEYYRGGDWAVVGSYQSDLIVAMAMLVKFLIAKVMIMHLIVLLEGSDRICKPVELLHRRFPVPLHSSLTGVHGQGTEGHGLTAQYYDTVGATLPIQYT